MKFKLPFDSSWASLHIIADCNIVISFPCNSKALNIVITILMAFICYSHSITLTYSLTVFDLIYSNSFYGVDYYLYGYSWKGCFSGCFKNKQSFFTNY